jgi:hypothetical protein
MEGIEEKSTVKPGWLRSWVEKILVQLKTNETQEWLQVYIADPLVSYVAGRVFPYIIITGIIFGAMFLFIILTFALVLFRTIKPVTPFSVGQLGNFCPQCSHLLNAASIASSAVR